MTDHVHALAMRTKAAQFHTDYAAKMLRNWPGESDAKRLASWHGTYAAAILALPLEADHAALLAESVDIGEVRALLWAARHAVSILSPHFNHASRGALETALKPFAALETP